jgi:hypothetical protein
MVVVRPETCRSSSSANRQMRSTPGGSLVEMQLVSFVPASQLGRYQLPQLMNGEHVPSEIMFQPFRTIS